MVNSEAVSLPEGPDSHPDHARILPSRISAIELTATYGGGARLGAITQLPQGAELEICGDGFNERTIKVCCEGTFYFVFRDDVEIIGSKN